ncbi:MAG: hypothetical protein CL878_02505, partial [Dehalococcoidia bacterium]|nr:hypothetical protein [Dehalococcoidia bacterium]
MKSETSELQEVCARLQELEAQYRTLTAQTRLKGVLSVTLASALSSLVAVLVVVGLNATAAGAQVRNEAAMPAQAIPLEGTDRFRVSIDPVGGHLVVSVLDDTKKNFLPILQFKGDLLHGPSALGAPQIWTKMFLQSPGTGLGHEFVEFRAGGDYPQGGQGIGGFLYRTVGQQLVEWAENWKGLAFATMSTSEQTVGTLGTIRLAIGADSTVEDVPITISDAFLIFDSGTVDPGEQPNISVKHT